GGSGGRIRLEAQDLVDVGAATGGAGETKQEIRGQRAGRCRDALPRDDRLIGATVEAVGETQQTVLRDLQLIEDRRRRTPGRAGFVGDLGARGVRSEEHTSELQSRGHLVCRLLLEKKKV